MPKIMEYPSITTIDAGTVLLSDGYSGTGIILASNLAKYVLEQYNDTAIGGNRQTIKTALNAAKSELSLFQVGQIGYFDNGSIDELTMNYNCGSYWIDCASTTITGEKPSTSGQGLLIVKQQSSNLIRQVYIPVTTGYDLVGRYYDISERTWTSWRDLQITNRIRGLVWRNITSGSTLADFQATVDSYYVQTGSSHVTGYMDGTRSSNFGLPRAPHFIEILAYSPDHKIVVATSVNGGDRYTLSKTGGTWATSWNSIFPGFDAIKILTAEDNLAALPPGLYRLNNAAPVGAPNSTLKYGYVYIDHKATSSYWYYEYVVGDGSATSVKFYHGWRLNAGSSVTWDDADINESFSLTGGKIVESGFNFDTAVTPGNWFIPTTALADATTGTRPTNSPIGYLKILKTRESANYTSQVFYAYDHFEAPWVRNYVSSSATWSDWVRVPMRSEFNALSNKVAAAELESGTPETVTASTDINSYITPGTYFFNSGVKPANNPNNTGYFRLVVTAPTGLLSGTNRVRYQEALTSQGIIFTRLLTSSNGGQTWSAQSWAKTPTRAEIDAISPRVKTVISDLSVILPGEQGYFQLVASISPIGAQAYFTIWCTGNEDRRGLIAIYTAGTETRLYANAGHATNGVFAWRGWNELSGLTEIATLTSAVGTLTYKCFKQGKVIGVALQIAVSEEIPANTVIVEGLPLASMGANYTIVPMSNNAASALSGRYLTAELRRAGNTACELFTRHAIPANGSIRISFTYLAE